MRNTREMIRRKRDGGELDQEEIRAFLAGVLDGSIPDYQTSAMLMAVYFRGMTDPELARFTAAMTDSGDRIQVESAAPKVDKHSTGGVGDKVSIPLAPLAAACGVIVPMMSGRGLGHTGGTLDKLESIPGFRTSLSPKEFAGLAARRGAAMAGQSERIAPADKVLYALRDTTATVSSIPLICSSIMSKKLAEGLDALVLDVKVGSGAFMETPADARRLAEMMVRIGVSNGVTTKAFLTDMNQPLGREVETPTRWPSRSRSCAAAARPTSGSWCWCSERPCWRRPGSRTGGPPRTGPRIGRGAGQVRRDDRGAGRGPLRRRGTRTAPRRRPLPEAAGRPGRYAAAIDARGIGLAAMRLGAGRQTADGVIDHGAGITLSAKVGDPVRRGDVLATLRFNDPGTADGAAALVSEAYRLADYPPEPRPLILEEVG